MSSLVRSETWAVSGGLEVRRARPPRAVEILAGARALGSVVYSIPQGSIYLATNGSDSNDGLTTATPKGTLNGAVSAAPTGGTIVMRGGTYESSYSGTMTKTGLTFQPYSAPGLGISEQVIWDGSKQRTSWTNNGNGTWTATLFAQFDHATPGGYAGGIDPAYPMAVWPDMVHVNGVRLSHRPSGTYSYVDSNGVTQTPAAETPNASQFTMNYTANTVTIGQDPTGKEVRLSSEGRFMVVRAANTTLRGFMIRRYATTLTSSTGTIDVSSSDFIAQDMHVEDCGQQSWAFGPSADNLSFRDCTVRRSSQLNIMVNGVNNLVLQNTITELSNFNMWKNEPGAGNAKFARLTNSTVRNCIVRDGMCAGLWFDVSCYNVTVFNNTLYDNRGPAIEWEISRKVLVVNNRITESGSSGFWALGGGEVRLWNNSIDRADSFDVRFEEDSRAGVVSSGENPDGVQDWRTDLAQVCNNVLTNRANRTGVWRVYFQNISIAEDTTSYFTRVGGNVWSSSSGTSVSRMFTYENSAGTAVTHTTPAAISGDPLLTAKVGSSRITTIGDPSTAQLATWAATDAEPLPADVASLLGVEAGSKYIGPIYPAPTARA